MKEEKITDFTRISAPIFKEAHVHDPSVIKVDDDYYVFGSHLAVAKTKDFMIWEQIATNAQGEHPIFDKPQEKFKETLAWAETKTFWAPDMVMLEDKTFRFYYNACRGDAPISAMGVASANNITGPFTDLGIILKSGNKDEDDGENKEFDATIHPNVIDPHVFFCEESRLWMMYGSFSGGIFILELDKTTGLPLENQGYGKKMLGKNHLEIEGPYVMYSPQTKFYYMFLTYGRLDPDGGYNMRVMRSEKPDGPYIDASGFNMSEAKGPDGTIFDRVTAAGHGSVIMRNHQFNNMDAYLSPGHNSVYYCSLTERYFLIFHVRFKNKNYSHENIINYNHEIRVHEMFINSKGWFVVSPHRFSNQPRLDYALSDVIGKYQFITHHREISADISTATIIELTADEKIIGDRLGHYKFDEKTGFIDLEIDGKRFDGVVTHQWNEADEQFVMTFTAMSDDGISIWGSKIFPLGGSL